MFTIKKSVFLIVVLIGFFQKASSENAVRSLADEIAELFFECFRGVLKEGIEEYKIPSFDPLELKHGELNLAIPDIDVNLTYNKIEVINLSKFKFNVDLEFNSDEIALNNYEIWFDIHAKGNFNGTFRIMDIISLNTKEDASFIADLKMYFKGNAIIISKTNLTEMTEFNIIPKFEPDFNIKGIEGKDMDELFSELIDFMINFFVNDNSDEINSVISPLVKYAVENMDKLSEEGLKFLGAVWKKCPPIYNAYKTLLQEERVKGNTIKIRV